MLPSVLGLTPRCLMALKEITLINPTCYLLSAGQKRDKSFTERR